MLPEAFGRHRGRDDGPRGPASRRASHGTAARPPLTACRRAAQRAGPCGRCGRPPASVRRDRGRAKREDLVPDRVRAICPAAPAIHVDHSHGTGRVRGVPCFNRDPAIGKSGDDPDTLRRAIAYLEGNAWKPTLVAPGVYQLPS
ncbi:endonuclease domain-containing protein [Streptomyces fulvorobeus]|uniref:endonuclease domain-containing protein n=1 Tax=Streptomyces fulvorobeus TaxID=284028 RepID=UPI002114DCC3|nr:endonuclease domain-containing protein [Streptomyces fulvorobeus]